MRLVECSDTDQRQPPPLSYTQGIKDEEISSPHTLQTLDKEMQSILSDSATDINQKWGLYNQVLQRYLGFVKRIREGDCTSSGITNDKYKNDRPSCADFDGQHSSPTFQAMSTPKKNGNSSNITILESGLPIRIRKRILQKAERLKRLKKLSRSIPLLNDSIEENYDDDDDADEDPFRTVDGEGTLTSPPSAVVNGWAESNIVP